MVGDSFNWRLDAFSRTRSGVTNPTLCSLCMERGEPKSSSMKRRVHSGDSANCTGDDFDVIRRAGLRKGDAKSRENEKSRARTKVTTPPPDFSNFNSQETQESLEFCFGICQSIFVCERGMETSIEEITLISFSGCRKLITNGLRRFRWRLRWLIPSTWQEVKQPPQPLRMPGRCA